jgi:tagatose 6-phosphate kinase
VILTITLNPALDVTYWVGRLQVGESHRVGAHQARAGGKGINVAAVLTSMGHPVLATGIAGGQTGGDVRADLDARGIPHRFLEGTGESRRTVTVVEDHGGLSTTFNEAGPTLAPAQWHAFRAHLSALLDSTDISVVVLSGSLPPGSPHDGYAHLSRQFRAARVGVLVDADGAALRHAVAASPTLVKPNLAELKSATGAHDLRAGVHALRRRGAADVVVSDGARGLVTIRADGSTARAWSADVLRGNPTGAGDAAAAALAVGLSNGLRPEESLPKAVAWSAAAVLKPLAGEIDPDDVAHLCTRVRTEELA